MAIFKRKQDRKHYVTDYAMTSPNEDLAETAAQYMINTIALWKTAIDQNSFQLMEKSKAIEEKIGREEGHRKYTTKMKLYRIPNANVQEFKLRAMALIHEGRDLDEIESVLAGEYSEFTEDWLGPIRPSQDRLIKRLGVGFVFGAIYTLLLLALLWFGALTFVHSIQSGWLLGFLVALVGLHAAGMYRDGLEERYAGVHFYKLSGIGFGLILIAIGGSWLGGWLLTRGYRLAFQLLFCVPAFSSATMVARWLLAAPDSRDENGKLKFGTRSALIALYFAFLSMTLTLTSLILQRLDK